MLPLLLLHTINNNNNNTEKLRAILGSSRSAHFTVLPVSVLPKGQQSEWKNTAPYGRAVRWGNLVCWSCVCVCVLGQSDKLLPKKKSVWESREKNLVWGPERSQLILNQLTRAKCVDQRESVSRDRSGGKIWMACLLSSWIQGKERKGNPQFSVSAKGSRRRAQQKPNKFNATSASTTPTLHPLTAN